MIEAESTGQEDRHRTGIRLSWSLSKVSYKKEKEVIQQTLWPPNLYLWPLLERLWFHLHLFQVHIWVLIFIGWAQVSAKFCSREKYHSWSGLIIAKPQGRQWPCPGEISFLLVALLLRWSDPLAFWEPRAEEKAPKAPASTHSGSATTYGWEIPGDF